MNTSSDFWFHAQLVHADQLSRRLEFGDREGGEHYLVFDRSEDSPDEAVPCMENVYLERDDQGWGGYGDVPVWFSIHRASACT